MLPLLMAGMGVAKGMADKQQEQRDRMLAAQTQQYSPWTKLQAQPVQKAKGGLEQGLQGGLSGMDFQSDNAMKDAIMGRLAAGEMETQKPALNSAAPRLTNNSYQMSSLPTNYYEQLIKNSRTG